MAPTSFTTRALRKERPVRVLLLEEDPAEALLVCKLIRSAAPDAFQITEAKTLSQAVSILGKENVDVILLDLPLPDSKGLEVLRRIKAERPAVPTVVFTGHDDLNLGMRAIQAGAEDYLIKGKPSGEALVRTLRYAIERNVMKAELTTQTEALKHTNKELERLNRMKMEFLSVISHELRTPLTSVRGFIRNLMDGVDGAVTQDQMHTLQRVYANLDRLRDLVDDLLDYQKLHGEYTKKVEPVDIERLLQAAVKDLEGMTHERGIRIFLEIGSRLPAIRADKVNLRRAVDNLLSNAVKFSSDDSAIRVRALSNPRVGLLRISVIDQGIGIREEDLEKIFEPFSQVDQSDRRNYGGTGLGLSIVKRIIEAHGGHVSVESTLGGGSVFSILLPCQAADTPQAKPGAGWPEGGAAPKRNPKPETSEFG